MHERSMLPLFWNEKGVVPDLPAAVQLYPPSKRAGRVEHPLVTVSLINWSEVVPPLPIVDSEKARMGAWR